MSATVQPQISINTRALVPLALFGLGALTLLFAIVTTPAPVVGQCAVVIGGGLTIAAMLAMPATPIFLLALNGFAALVLLLQALGLCQAHCGGFVDYQRFLAAPTALAGFALHVALAGLGAARFQGRIVSVGVYRAALAMGQGASLFFALIMLAHRHWCASCATSHVLMAAQAVMLWRLTPDATRRAFWAMTVAIAALATNAIYHHRYDRPELGPGDHLLGWIQRAAAHDTVGIVTTDAPTTPAEVAPSAAPDATRSVGAARAAKAEPGAHATPLQESAMQAGAPLRRLDFFRWGAASAPITVRAHMSPVCPGCRDEWPKLDNVRPLVNAKQVQVEFVFTWPIKPEAHFGAQLGTYVLYNAGLHGEDELMAVGDRIFGADGLQLMNQIQAVLTTDADHGRPSANGMKDALVELFKFTDQQLPATTAVQSYTRFKSDIDDYLTKSVSWLAEHGDLSTPRFYFLRTANSDGPAYLDTTTLDPEVWSAFIHKGQTTSKKGD